MRRQDDEQTRSISSPAPLGQVKVGEWTLEVISGDDRGKRISTAGALIRVGSDTTNELALTDPAVGRCHLQIERTPLGLLLRDLGSRDGRSEERRVGKAG